ncbi:MAG: response regulator [Proteobacteria bacterium]|nr:response regulator [Pseudomonadota bacterium]
MPKSTVMETTIKHTILYIEDNPANLKLVNKILSKHSHINLITAHEPDLGFKLASIHQPELILLDINMPGMNGYQVLEKLQADKQLHNIPVIAVTANAMEKDIERGKQAGFSDYMTKPLNIEEFISTINLYIKQD